MVRRMYLTIAMLLVMSTGLLLMLLGVAVYRELNTELTQEGERALRAQADTIRDAIRDVNLRQNRPGEGDIHDNRGQYVFFYAQSKMGAVESLKKPIPYSFIKTHPPHQTFGLVTYHKKWYRFYSFTTQTDNVKYHVYAYSLISEERSVLHHVSSLMWTVGGAGFILALLGNLFLARRLVQPTLRTWHAYRETVLELSHELQTPLATVKAMMTSRNVESTTAHDVGHEIDRASQMVSDMLYLSRLKSGVKERETEPTAVSDITEDVAFRYQELAKEHGIQLNGRAQPGLFVETTSGEWERLVSTLFKNVVDHGQPGGRAHWQIVGDGRFVELRVENAVRKMKDDKSRPPERGVGLQIAKRILQHMRGTLQTVQKAGNFIVIVRVKIRRRHW